MRRAALQLDRVVSELILLQAITCKQRWAREAYVYHGYVAAPGEETPEGV